VKQSGGARGKGVGPKAGAGLQVAKDKLATHSSDMPVNLDKPQRWKDDTKASVDYYNRWFIRFAPKAFRETRVQVTSEVEKAIADGNNLIDLSPDILRSKPQILRTLRMACCPPIAVDRLVGLAYSTKTLVSSLEAGKVPARMSKESLIQHLASIIDVIQKMLDPDIFVWIGDNRKPTKDEVYRASTIVADRLTGADANPIIRNAQEKRQLSAIERFLAKKGYKRRPHPPGIPIHRMEPGTFTFHYSVATGRGERKVDVSIDAMIQPRKLRPDKLPILVEAKSAGDFTNTNKRRKEKSKKISQLQDTFGRNVCYVLFLCGYFDAGYLGYEAQDGIDWVWEHRIEDFDQLGI
jgi:type II restriction enzyme